jgi:hypothetical protein
VGVVKRRVLRGLWRRLVGVGIIGPGLLGAPALIMLLAALGRLFGAAFALPSAPPRPHALSPPRPRSLRRAHNTRRYEHPLFGVSCPIGVGRCKLSRRCELRQGEVLRSALRKDMLQLYLLSREPFTLLQDRFLLSF